MAAFLVTIATLFLISVATLMVDGQSTNGTQCGTPCTSDSNCTGNGMCLCQIATCENRTCTCGPDFYESGNITCFAKKRYQEICTSSEECATWFAQCTKDRCTCPENYKYDPADDECTNAPPCPKDPSYVHSPEANVCHRVIQDCSNCGNIEQHCSGPSIEPLVLNNLIIMNHFYSTLWHYGFYRTDDVPAIIVVSTNQTRDADGPSGEPVSCRYVQYDSNRFMLISRDDCNLTTANVACMLQLPQTFCQPNTDSNGTRWNFTQGGITAEMPCKEKYEGIIRRECTLSGTFELPDYNNCTLVVIRDISKQLTNGSVNATEALTLLTSEVTTQQNLTLFAGDLIAVEDILSAVAELALNQTVDNTTADKFLEVANLLIDPKNDQAWESKRQERNEGAERLLNSVDKYVEQLAVSVATKNETVRIVKPNLELEVRVIKPAADGGGDDLSFPPEPVEKERNENITENSPNTPKPRTSKLFLNRKSFTGSNFNVTGASSLLYKNLSSSLSNVLVRDDGAEDNETKIRSQVLSLTLYPKAPPVLNPPLRLVFVPSEDIPSGYAPRCSYWDAKLLDGKGAWSTEGCKLVSANNTEVACDCDHLTNFALLISPVRASGIHEKVLRYISMVGCGVSILFLVITIGYYWYYWRFLKSDNATLTFSLCISLLLAYILFIVGVDRTSNKALCTAIAVILHYVYLVVFFAMLSEGLHMLTMVAMVYDRKSYVRQFLVGTFALPAVIVAISMGASKLEGYGNEHYCWLPAGTGVFWAFAGPVLVIIAANLFVTGLIMKKLCSTSAMKNKTTEEKVRISTWTLCVLMPIMGITWLFGIFSVSEDTVAWQYVFVILNALQGFGIFVFHCVLNKQLRAAIEASKERKRTVDDFTSELKKRVAEKSKDSSTADTGMSSTMGGYSTFESSGCKPSHAEMSVTDAETSFVGKKIAETCIENGEAKNTDAGDETDKANANSSRDESKPSQREIRVSYPETSIVDENNPETEGLDEPLSMLNRSWKTSGQTRENLEDGTQVEDLKAALKLMDSVSNSIEKQSRSVDKTECVASTSCSVTDVAKNTDEGEETDKANSIMAQKFSKPSHGEMSNAEPATSDENNPENYGLDNEKVKTRENASKTENIGSATGHETGVAYSTDNGVEMDKANASIAQNVWKPSNGEIQVSYAETSIAEENYTETEGFDKPLTMLNRSWGKDEKIKTRENLEDGRQAEDLKAALKLMDSVSDSIGKRGKMGMTASNTDKETGPMSST